MGVVEQRLNMYKLDIPLDLKEQAAVERRRRAEQERQGRVFNSRYRQIGVCIHIGILYGWICIFS